MIMIKWPFYNARICESNSQQVFAPKLWISHLCEQIFSLNIASVVRPYWNIWQKKSTERNNVATVEAEFFSVVWIIWVCIWTTIEVNGNCDKPCSFHLSVEISKSKRGIYFLEITLGKDAIDIFITSSYDQVNRQPWIVVEILWKLW